MKSFLKLVFLFFILSSLISAQDFPAVPNPPRLVNDFASMLSHEERGMLEQKLVAFNDSTSTQIAIVIIKTLDGYPISDYTIKLGEKWGIGQKQKNNGALILVAKDDHEVFISTGYGLEGAIPDALCKRIVETQIVPEFKNGNYFGGLDAATDMMIKLASGEYTADDVGQQIPKNILPGIFIFILFVIIIIIFSIRKTKNYAHTNGIDFWTAWTLLNAARSARRGSWGNFSSGSGGFGGFGGGGGFGGFGGGSFGGGGAGGKW